MTDHSACPACGAELLDIDVRCRACGEAVSSTGAQRLVGSVVLEHYEVIDVLGQGGMSVVYHARHRLTEQSVALKILTPELAAHSQLKSRFVEEARALAQLDHPNIVHLYNFGQEGGGFALAMQYVEGPTWERLILEDDDLDWRRSTKIAIDVLRALEYAHGRGIVHRDMKPSNVLIRDSDGSATVMDFGIAKMTTSSRLTATGQTMGTIRYMSPEQVRGVEVDARSDIYSVACTLYESLLGDTPFDGDTHFEIMTKHLSEPPIGLRRQGVECPAELDQAILSALAKKVEDRPSTAAIFRAQLEACLLQEPEALDAAAVAAPIALPAGPKDVETVPSGQPVVAKRGPRLRLWAALGVAVLGAGAAALFAVMGGAADKPKEHVDGEATGGAPPAAAVWPEPFIYEPNTSFAVDVSFDDDHVRVLSTTRDVDPDLLREAVRSVTAEFSRFLADSRLPSPGVQPLNIVVVERPEAFCDPRMFERGRVPPRCITLTSYLRTKERTLFQLQAGREEMVAAVRIAQPENMCLHMKTLDCLEVVGGFKQSQANPDKTR